MRKPLVALIITVLLAPASYAADVYRYRDNMPAAEMMLKLMDLFGVVDRIPDPYSPAYAGSGFTQSNSDQMNYMRYLKTVQGMQLPGTGAGNPMSGMNPLAFSGMQMNPLLGAMGTNPFSAPISQNMTPSMGSLGGMQSFTNNPIAMMQDPFKGEFPNVPQKQPRQAISRSNTGAQIPGFFSNTDIAKITQEAKRDVLSKSNPSFRATSTQSNHKLTTTSIGLDGTWRNAGSEVLMIDKNRFIWEDGKGRDLTGYLKITATTMTANIPKSKGLMVFQYAIQGNRLSVIAPKTRQAFHFIRARR